MKDHHVKVRIEAAIGLFVLFLLFFVTIRFGVYAHNTFLSLDQAASVWSYSIRTPALTSVMLFFTYLGNWQVILSLEILLIVILLIVRRKSSVWLMIAALLLGQVATGVFKLLADRARPDTYNLLGIEGNTSFPSWHALIGIFFYGIIAHLIVIGIKQRSVRVVVRVVALAVGLMIGLSRVYLGVHWFSDVIGGFVLGAVLLIIVIIFFERAEMLFRRATKDSSATSQPNRTRHFISKSCIFILLLLEAVFISYFYYTHPLPVSKNAALIQIQSRAHA